MMDSEAMRLRDAEALVAAEAECIIEGEDTRPLVDRIHRVYTGRATQFTPHLFGAAWQIEIGWPMEDNIRCASRVWWMEPTSLERKFIEPTSDGRRFLITINWAAPKEERAIKFNELLRPKEWHLYQRDRALENAVTCNDSEVCDAWVDLAEVHEQQALAF